MHVDLWGIGLGVVGLFVMAFLIGQSIATGIGDARRRMDGPAGGPGGRSLEGGGRSRPPILHLIAYAVGALLLIGAVTRFRGSEASTEPDDAPETTAGETAPRIAEPEIPGFETFDESDRFLERSEELTEASVLRAQVAAAKDRQRQALDEAEDTLAALDRWERAQFDWEDYLASLSRDNAGRALAADEDLVRQYRALVAIPHPTDEDGTLHARADELFEVLRAAYEEPADVSEPDESLLEALREIESEANEGERAFTNAKERVELLVRRAGRRSPELGQTLAEAVADQQEAETLRETTRILAAREEAREEAERMLAEVVAEGERRIAEARAQSRRAQDDAEVQLEEETARRIAEQAKVAADRAREEREALIAEQQRELLEQQFEREYPAMATYLTPFTSQGYQQPRGVDRWVREPEQAPVSLGGMRGSGMIGLDERSVGRLYFMAAANEWNDRPLGSFPEYGGLPRGDDTVLRVGKFLVKYGDLMVEKGLLLP